MIRPRRLRNNAILRDAIAEINLSVNDFVFPYFVCKGKNIKKEIPSMPGIHHFSIDLLQKDIAQNLKLGLNKILIFGVGEEKDAHGTACDSDKSIAYKTIKTLKKEFGQDLFIFSDVCLCPYTSHGHCGIIEGETILNDPSVEILAKMALSHAEAGVDMLAPSDMMDGRIQIIREELDDHGFESTGIMSYAVKYASSYYGPFREAADSAPGFGDRKSYQMDFRNRKEALKEALTDIDEGADMLMVKPALAYLDVIERVSNEVDIPVTCYNVSGEYAMVKAAAEKGWVDEAKVVLENFYAMKRAGANLIFTYHIQEAIKKGWL